MNKDFRPEEFIKFLSKIDPTTPEEFMVQLNTSNFIQHGEAIINSGRLSSYQKALARIKILEAKLFEMDFLMMNSKVSQSQEGFERTLELPVSYSVEDISDIKRNAENNVSKIIQLNK